MGNAPKGWISRSRYKTDSTLLVGISQYCSLPRTTLWELGTFPLRINEQNFNRSLAMENARVLQVISINDENDNREARSARTPLCWIIVPVLVLLVTSAPEVSNAGPH